MLEAEEQLAQLRHAHAELEARSAEGAGQLEAAGWRAEALEQERRPPDPLPSPYPYPYPYPNQVLLFARGLPRMTFSYMRYPVMSVHATR